MTKLLKTETPMATIRFWKEFGNIFPKQQRSSVIPKTNKNPAVALFIQKEEKVLSRYSR